MRVVTAVVAVVLALVASGCSSEPSDEQRADARRACEQARDAYERFAQGFPSPSFDAFQETSAELRRASGIAPDGPGDHDIRHVKPALRYASEELAQVVNSRRANPVFDPGVALEQTRRALIPADTVAYWCDDHGVQIDDMMERWKDS